MASPGAAWRYPPPRRRGNRTHTIKNKVPRNRSYQMDRFQSKRRARLHVYSNCHRAASANLIDLAWLDSGVRVKAALGRALRATFGYPTARPKVRYLELRWQTSIYPRQ